MSATVFSSSTTSLTAPGSPKRANPGAFRRGEASAALPSPPRPPWATTYVEPAPTKSARTTPSSPLTTVPSGTGRIMSSPLAPSRLLPCPGFPEVARRCGAWWNASNVVVSGSTTSATLPPRPPVPPSGPPSGLYFSRWIDAQPLPPLPALACRTTRSTNVGIVSSHRSQCAVPFRNCDLGNNTRADRNRFALVCHTHAVTGLGPRDDVDHATAAGGTEFDDASCEGEERVVLATTDVQAWVVMGAALPDQDLAGVDQLTAVALDTEELRIGVAAVAAGRRAFLVGHASSLLSGLDAGDLQAAVALTVALPLAVPGLVLVLQDVDLGTLGVVDDFGRHLDVAERLGIAGHRVTIDEEESGERQRRAGLAIDPVDLDDVADGHLVLPAAAANDRVHRGTPACSNLTTRTHRGHATPTTDARRRAHLKRADPQEYGPARQGVKPGAISEDDRVRRMR